MQGDALISVEGVHHHFGQGALRREILHGIDLEIHPGEIVIMTGPSGSGKTTLLTLIGALRSTQDGSVRVLGQQLRGASQSELYRVRRQLGYIFQAHNLLDALTVSKNVQLGLLLHGVSRSEMRKRAAEMLEAVGLSETIHRYPSQISGGQRQRVAIARALVASPRIVLADEPTGSLDKESGREVVEIMRRLAREQQVPVLLVTHDNRILDIADRIIHMEDGRLQSATEAVTQSTRQMMGTLARSGQQDALVSQVADMPPDQFVSFLEDVTRESREFLEVAKLYESDAFESMLEQTLQAFTFKLGDLLGAERASLFLLDREREELWLRVARDEGGRTVRFRVPIHSSVAGQVALTGKPMRVEAPYEHPLFNPAVDKVTGFLTRGILSLPVFDSSGAVFAVAQLLNRIDGEPFDDADEQRFTDFLASISVILESWWHMTRLEAARQWEESETLPAAPAG